MGGLATAPKPARQRRYSSFTFICLLSVVALGAVSLWLRAGGWSQVTLVQQPGVTVTAINREAKTLTLSRVRESFAVSCESRCDLFEVGKRYSMGQREGFLEFTRKAEKIELPILREHYDFETPPGGHG